MLSSSHPACDGPIELDDPLEAFQDFTAMLLTPLKSCIYPSHPTTKDVGRLLRLLVLCNKYAAREFEEHLVGIVKPLVQEETLPSNLKADLTVTEVLRVANAVDRLELAEAARQILLDELWGDSTRLPTSTCSSHETLLFAESIGDEELIGAAYYRLLMSGDVPCSSPLRQTLDRGMIRCGEEWQKIFNSWGQGKTVSGGSLWRDEGFYRSCPSSSELFLSGVWSSISEASLPWFDVVGKVQCATYWQAANLDGWYDGRGTPTQQELARIKKEVYSYFVEKPPV